jgi:hypothetical protein
MIAERPSLDEAAGTALKLLSLMKRDEPEHVRLWTIIRVAVTRLCAIQSASVTAQQLHALADVIAKPRRSEDLDGVPRRQTQEGIN